MPDFEAKVMPPPPACPNSGLNPLVSTENSVIASSDGVRNAVSVMSACRLVFTDTPSSVAPNAPPCPPPSETAVFPTPPPLLASATVEIRSNGLRIAPPTTSGSSSISRFDTAVAILRVFGLQRGVLGDDVHRLGHRAEVQRHVDTRGGAGGEDDARDDRGAEPLERGFDAIGPRRQVGRAEAARVGRDDVRWRRSCRR